MKTTPDIQYLSIIYIYDYFRVEILGHGAVVVGRDSWVQY